MTDSTWQGPVSGNWSEPASWSAGVPNGVDDIARVTDATVTIDSSMPSGATIGSLYLSQVGIKSVGAAPLVFDTSGSAAILQAAGDDQYVLSRVVLNDPLAVDVSDERGDMVLLGCITTSVAGTGITLTGTGGLWLTNINTYDGPTTVAGGALRATDGRGLPATSNLVLDGGEFMMESGAVFTRPLGTGPGQVQWTGSGGFLAFTDQATVNIGGQALPDTLVWGQGGFVPIGSELTSGSVQNFAEIEFQNPIDLAGGMRTLRVNSHATLSLCGGLFNGGLKNEGYGFVVLKTPCTYTGATEINHGTLRLATDNALADTSAVTIAHEYATLDIGEHHETVGPVTLIDGTITGTTGVLSAPSFEVHQGTVEVGLGGSGGLVKTTTGSARLDGASTYAGPTQVLSGHLTVEHAQGLGSPDAGTTVADGASLRISTGEGQMPESITITGMGSGSGALLGSGTISGTVTVAGDTGIHPYNLTLAGPVICPYDLTMLDDGTLTLSGPSQITGHIRIGDGTVRLGGDGVGSGTGRITVFRDSPSTGPGCLDVGTSMNAFAMVTLESGTIKGTSGVLSAGAFDVRLGNISADLGGTGGVTKTTADTVSLTGDNSYTGLTTVAEGVLRIAGESALGSAAAGTVVSTGATLELSDDASIVGEHVTLSGPGVDGTGALRLIEGKATLAGRITLATDTTICTKVESGHYMGDDLGITGIIEGPGGLTKTGVVRLQLSGANTYAGETVVTEGELLVKHASALGATSAGTTVADGATLTVGSDVGAEPLTISGELPLRAAAGQWSWAGPIHLAGDTSISVGSGRYTFDYFLHVSGPIDDGHAAYSLTKKGVGILALTGASGYGGATMISGGALRAREGQGLPLTSNLQLGGVYESDGPHEFTRSLGTGPGQVQWTGSGGFSAYGGKLTVNIGGMATPMQLTRGVTPYFVLEDLEFGSAAADSEVEFRNPIDLSNGLSVSVRDNPATEGDCVTLSGVLSGSGGLGMGRTDARLILAANNTYTGRTTVYGVVQAAEGVGLPVASNVAIGHWGVLQIEGPAVFDRSLGNGPGQVQWVGDWGGGFAAIGGTLVVNIGGEPEPETLRSSDPYSWGDCYHYNKLMFGSKTADSEVVVLNPLCFGAGGSPWPIFVRDNPATEDDFVTLAGGITNGALIKEGPGTLVLAADNALTHDTYVYQGTLRLGPAGTLGDSGVWVREGATLDVRDCASFTMPVDKNLWGDGQVRGSVRVEGTVAPGESAGILTVDDIDFAPGSALEIDLRGADPGEDHDVLVANGAVSIDGAALRVMPGASFAPVAGDRFSIITHDGLSGWFANLEGVDYDGRLTLRPVYGAADVALLAIQAGSSAWQLDRDGLASNPENWQGTVVPGGAGDVATFGSAISAPRLVTLDLPITLGRIHFDNASAYTLGGSATLTMQDAADATITVTELNGAGDHDILAPVCLASPLAIDHDVGSMLTFAGTLDNTAGHTITKTGIGTAVFIGLQTHGPGAELRVHGGQVNLDADAGTPLDANLAVFAHGGDVRFSATQHLVALDLDDTHVDLAAHGDRTVFTLALAMDVTDASFDLADNTLVVDYTGGASPFDEILADVTSGYSGGSWDGLGIHSSAAAAHVQGLAALGVIDDGEKVLVDYCWAGDANLDGVVDTNDYDRINTNWLLWTAEGTVPDGGFRWAVGDFNYDGTIDTNDYDKINNAWLISGSAPLGGGVPVPTPEPATLALLALGGLMLTGPKRKR